MKSVSFVAPAVFCAIIAFPAFFTAARRDHNWPQALLCAFLPGCFLCLAAVLIQMSREISRLRRRIARLEDQGAPANHASPARPPAGADSLPAARADASTAAQRS